MTEKQKERPFTLKEQALSFDQQFPGFTRTSSGLPRARCAYGALAPIDKEKPTDQDTCG
jgi:hypothetical protein